jgi:serine/threonine protein kinase/formylglycine-generating enzyme required for sulfatase activity
MSESKRNGERAGEGAAKGAEAQARPSHSHTVDESFSPDDVGPFHDVRIPRGTSVGRFLVLETLGAGAMGVAYAAYDPELDRKIALKFLRQTVNGDAQQARQARLVREAQAIAKLAHPNVVGIFDVGVHEQQVFLAMEYLGGGTLRQWLAAEKRSWREIVAMYVAAGRGLAAAHADGLIHRDFKPDNVLLDRNGTPKVVDFGLVRLAALTEATESEPATLLPSALTETAADLARPATAPRPPSFSASSPASGSVSSRVSPPAGAALVLSPTTAALGQLLTRPGALAGTPAYMAPEQLLARAIDARADQFAFCVSLWEALYGERPFGGETLAALAKAVVAGQLRPPRDAQAVPRWIHKLLLRGLSGAPAERYPSLTELLDELGRDPAVRRRRLLTAAVAVVVLAATGVGLQRHFERRRLELERRISAKLGEGEKAFADARALKTQAAELRARALAAFDAHDRTVGERAWGEARVEAGALDRALERTQGALQAVLAMDKGRADARRPLVEATFERALLAEQEVRREDLARHLSTLESVDVDGEQRRRWAQPGTLSLRTVPPATVTIERFSEGAPDDAGRIAATVVGGPMTTPIAGHPLPPGSYRLRIGAGGAGELLYPFVVKRGEPASIELRLPAAGEIPPGFRYVPTGRFMFGDPDDQLRVAFLNAVPMHERAGGAFLIQEHETTFGEWLQFLASLPAEERAARIPGSKGVQGSMALTPTDDGRWKLRLNVANRPIEAASGQPIVYPGRQGAAAQQDWSKLPVVGVSPTDMRAYLGWFASARGVPGARFCTEAEWERAARGADGRAYPNAMTQLLPEDANVDATYGRVPGAYGPDEVGRRPRGRSPFGLDDMAGNVWEVVENDDVPHTYVARGGGYYHDFKSARSTNREVLESELRSPMIGLRVCADVQPGNKVGGTQ